MHDALKLFSLYMSLDIVYIEAVLGCPEKKMFPFFSVFLTPFFFLRLNKDIISVLKYLFIQICTELSLAARDNDIKAVHENRSNTAAYCKETR